MQFEFATAERIIFGVGCFQEVGEIAAELGRRPYVVTGSSEDRNEPLLSLLATAGLEITQFAVSGEPNIKTVQDGVDLAREEGCDFVIGFGGGSVIDAGKAIAAMMTNKGELLDYLEVIGAGNPLTEEPVPCIAIPTTAGTGAEVTRNAVLGSPEHRVKVSLRSPLMLPDRAVVDPQLTYSMPPALTASTGMDALTQVIEPYVSNKANAITDAVCKEGMKRAGRSLLRAYQNGDDRQAREDMALASMFGGLALANAKLGAVHGFAGPLGGRYEGPHGAICGRLLPAVVEVNLRALRERAAGGETLSRYEEVARLLTGDENATLEDGLAWIQALDHTFMLPPLSDYGLRQKDFGELIEMAAGSSSMQGNPITLTREELAEILERAI